MKQIKFNEYCVEVIENNIKTSPSICGIESGYDKRDGETVLDSVSIDFRLTDLAFEAGERVEIRRFSETAYSHAVVKHVDQKGKNVKVNIEVIHE